MEGYLDNLEALDSRQFWIAVKRLADSLGYGTDRSPYLGSGVEYVQSRQYQWGDPVKAIDWRVTARTGKPHIKEYEAPKRLPVYLLIDTSASMTISSQATSKYSLAVHIAAGLAYAALDRVSPVGVLGVGERDLHVVPSLSKDQIMQWCAKLRHYRYDEQTTLGSRLTQLNTSLLSRSLVILLSDLHDPTALPALKLLSQQHDCVALQLQDAAETDLRKVGVFRGREVETGQAFVSTGASNWLDQDQLEQQLKRAGIDHVLIRTDRPFVHTLRYFFGSRNIFGRGAR